MVLTPLTIAFKMFKSSVGKTGIQFFLIHLLKWYIILQNIHSCMDMLHATTE